MQKKTQKKIKRKIKNVRNKFQLFIQIHNNR